MDSKKSTFEESVKPVLEKWMVDAANLKESQPKHILFLCAANSAHSQMAEGIARSFQPSGVQFSSAGSTPSMVSPLSIRVLGEIGIDISGHLSKGFRVIDSSSVDTVITLCADESCATYFEKANRIHWGFPEPDGIEEFRDVRDELQRRLGFLFGNWE
ncbi:arsenate reductase ArsC [Bdellovibrionota bacterium FG-1]